MFAFLSPLEKGAKQLGEAHGYPHISSITNINSDSGTMSQSQNMLESDHSTLHFPRI
jgi:hypothetical protein